MKNSSVLIIVLSLLSSAVFAQTELANVTVQWKRNNVIHFEGLLPSNSITIRPDQGTQVNVTIRRAPGAKLPADFLLADYGNGATYSEKSSNYSVTYNNCAGPKNTKLLALVNNNIGSVSIFIEWVNPPLPDLAVSGITVNADTQAGYETYHVGQTVTLRSIVWNVGGTSAGSSRLGYYIKSSANNTSGSPFAWSQASTITPEGGSSQKIEYTFTAQDAGTRYFVLEADYRNDVAEANETNNVASFGPFQVVSPPSLAITPALYYFGTIALNQCGEDQNFRLTNDGGTAISGFVALRNGTHFSLSAGSGSFTLNPGQTRDIKVRFCPKSTENITDDLLVFQDGISNPFASAGLSGQGFTPPESIVGISDEFTFDTRGPFVNSGGIFLKIIETAGTNKVKKVGYEYNRKNSRIISNKFEVDQHGYVFLKPPVFPDEDDLFDHNDFLNQILLFDENDNQIGHINFSYSFAWEGMHSRHAVLFFHNDDEIIGADMHNPYFPYHADSPNNYKGIPYKYYQFGEYPVSMLIPPHFQAEEHENHPEGYRFPYEYAGVKPIVFVHGLWGSFSYNRKADPKNTLRKGDQVSYWHYSERKVNHKINSNSVRLYHAWQFYYPAEDDLRHCGMMLREAINYLYPKYEPHGEKIGIMAHSMGGLVTMDYLTTNHYNYNEHKIGKVLLSMSPLHGSIAANRTYHNWRGILIEIADLLSGELGDKHAPCYRDMSLGSEFLNTLHNRNWSDYLNPDNIFSIIGLTPKEFKLPKSIHKEAVNHEDGIVGYSSASLLDHGIGFLGIYGNHDDGKYGSDDKSGQLLDDYFIPWLIDKYFSSSYDVFKYHCQINEEVRVFVEGDKNIVIPLNTSHMYLLDLDENDVDLQRGMVTLVDATPSPKEIYYLYEINDSYYLGPEPSGFGVHRMGRFHKHRYWNRYFFDYFNSQYTPIGQSGEYNTYEGWDFQWPDGVGLNITILDDANMPVGSRPITKKNTEHQFVHINTSPLKTQLAIETTPTKNIPASNMAEELKSTIFVDDQTTMADFYLYSSPGNARNIPYHISLIAPDGSTFNSTSTNVTYIENDQTSLKILSIDDPIPGKWQMSPIVGTEYSGMLSYITLCRLSSEIKAQSLISKSGHELHLPSELSGIITIPDKDLLLADSLKAHMIIQNHSGLPDTLYLDNIELTDTGYIFSNNFEAIAEGVHSYTMIITGIYNDYRYERALYGDFIVEDLAPVFNIPDQLLNITKRFVNPVLPQYFSCPQCTNEDVVFQVGIMSSTFKDEDIFYAFSSETNRLTISVSQDAPLAQAHFVVDALIEDSIVAHTGFRVSYTTPGVPDYLSASDITLNSAKLSWIPKGIEQQWDINYGISGFNPETEGILIAGATDRPYALESLIQSSTYDFFVRAVINDTLHTAWSWPAEFTTNHLITASAGEKGSIDPEGDIEVMHRGSQVYNIVPDEHYHIYDVLIDQESVGAVSEYIFEDVDRSHSIQAVFAINVYNIEASVNIENYGTIAGTGEYEFGQTATLAATSQDTVNYIFINWTEEGTPVHDQPEYTFTVNSNRDLVANFQNVTSVNLQDENHGIKVFPVPAGDFLIIQSELKIKHVRLVDVLGKEHYSESINDLNHIIGVSHLKDGFYVLIAVTDKGFSTHRIQISK